MDIHRCRFVSYPPSAINALAFSHPSSAITTKKSPSTPTTIHLALGRSNGDIEIWSPYGGIWRQESILLGGKDRSIEGLVWIQDPGDTDKQGYRIPGKLRLFSIGYSTNVTEWDLAHGRAKRHSGGNYGEIWCMAAQPSIAIKTGKHITNRSEEEKVIETQSIAVGCADGAIVLLSTADDDLGFKKIVARASKKRARVLSLTFQNRSIVVAGHADSTIRVYDIRNGQQLRNMTLGAGPKGGPKETLVWSVRCFDESFIVSGDSTGTLCFWDGKTYALMQRIKAHDADILDVAVSADGQSVFSGGIDRRTVCYQRGSGVGQSGIQSRWARMSHSRLHEHDVKAMAAYESKTLSILASGGLDTNPILLPIRQFGKEHHRTLSSLPQRPPLLSVPEKRLLLSWWDRQINIWAIPRRRLRGGHEQEHTELPTSQGRRLVAKVMLTGDEAIASVTVTSAGDMLAVSTVASTKMFQLIPRKDGTLKVQKLSTAPYIARSGAKLVHFSPDSKWLCQVQLSDQIRLCRLDPQSSTSEKSTSCLPKTVVKLDRLSRPETRLKPENGTLGKYHRSIMHVAFSADSNLLAVSDLSGYLDTWLLAGEEDLTQASESIEVSSQRSSSSSDSDSGNSSDSDKPTSSTLMYGQQWIRNPAASLLPKLPGQPLVLSFRPSTGNLNHSIQSTGRTTPPATRHTPQPHSHTFQAGEDRLLAITAGNKILEFHILAGRLTDWSRRNPSSVFPDKFRGLMDQAKGVVWDVCGSKGERCWIYGVNWLWMFDLTQDLQPQQDPSLQFRHKTITIGGEMHDETVNGDDHDNADGNNASTIAKMNTARSKRKRDVGKAENDDEDNSLSLERTSGILATTGAGGQIPTSQMNVGLGRKMRRIEGTGERDGESVQIIDLDPCPRRKLVAGDGILDDGEDQQRNDPDVEDDQDVDGESDGDIAVNTSSALVRLRRNMEQDGARREDGDREDEDSTNGNNTTKISLPQMLQEKKKQKGQEEEHQRGPAYWFTFKYRPILGIVPLSSPSQSTNTQVRRHGDHDYDHDSSRMNGSAMEMDVDAEAACKEEEEEEEEAEVEAGMEVALVERPLWDVEVDLPARFHGTQEWGK